MDEPELIVTCSCSRLDHAVRFTFHDGSEAYIDVCLDYDRPWWRRLRTALRYLFKRTCDYGEASEIVVQRNALRRIRAWVERAEREITK